MKLSNLTIAVLIALGTAACGGSGDAAKPPHVDPQPKPAPQPDNGKNQPGRDDKALVDPTNTHVVDNRDLSKESTVGGLQYIRRDGSGYDRANNPEKMASATPLLGVSLNRQNPKLTNIVLARRDLDYHDGRPVRAQFAGGTDVEPLTAAGKPREDDSLQVENFKNVDVLAGAFKQVGSAVFSDPNNRLNGTTHNIDTHIQNNTDKDGEFTRERVTHVYTPRYEYRQPYVDYPHAKNEADIGKEHAENRIGPEGTSFTTAPPPPIFNNPEKRPEDRVTSINDLEKKLKGDHLWATRNVNDNSRWITNIGTRTTYASGEIYNDQDRYGNFPASGSPDPAADNHYDDSPTDGDGHFPATSWRNNLTQLPDRTPNNDINHWSYKYNGGNIADDTGNIDDTARKYNRVDWNGSSANDSKDPKRWGAYAGKQRGDKRIDAGGITPQDAEPDYRRDYPNGAYPKHPKTLFAYPNRPYDEANNNAIDTRKRGRADTNPMDHEHIYLEREEYTAIRQIKGIRPLVNPVPNEWDWTLKQVWGVTYNIDVQKRKQVWVQNGPNPGDGYYRWENDGASRTVKEGTPLSEEVKPPVEDNEHTTITANGTVSNLNNRTLTDGTVCDGGATLCTIRPGGEGEEKSWVKHLISAEWIKPINTGGGVRGEFRGPPYIGWKEDDRVVRFADNRIWKPGTPGYKPEYENKYGANLIWWSTQDSAFENWATSEGWNPRARRVDINTENCPGGDKCGEGKEDLVWGKNTKPRGVNARDRDVEIQPTGDITNGLIRIGGYGNHGDGQPDTMRTLGEELTFDGARWNDHHKTTTRIFGHYHLAYADQDDRSVKAMSMNSYSGARSFVSQVEGTLATPTAQGYRADLDSKPTQYSLGAKPITLKKVQYGRVTTNLDLTASGTKLLPNGFLRAPFEKKGTGDSVDNYFFRGVDETTIEQMNALPSNQVARYEGHALMYGIDNSFHGIRTNRSQKDLPNAFDGTGGQNATAHTLGLGNFVEAEVNFGTKKVTGDVYNAWLEQLDKPGVYKDKLVTFSGNVIGNTVIGTADRTYAPGNDEADFRAAFYGSQADEMGGSFNSVKATNKYGSAYEVGDWGGVFGATKVGTNTFQGDDGGQTYGGGSAPAQTPNVADRYAP
ncbi:transferrin-binding protein-like solute binding protein [Cardiobacterium valvarum]|uniref:Transferrin-binding protein B C-lobe/N-lobe beta-barrel domain-containing protein n=1 Tax=Cardiobacterium valvarum F0432 TaxID=797473 RepID=G9ZCV5_9GAMM|nr:transferrin-binding protein-like solute binding protein [Cardiobacterium valvarum]EHM55619.1 hypothetical protein HMPREF9080_00584 [Cardiobacterium valvarum F0432]